MKTWFQSNPFWRNEAKTEAMTIYCTQVEGQEIEYFLDDDTMIGEEEQLKTEQRKKSEKLEALFSMKLRAFEIQEVRECKEQFLRTKVRSSKTEVEMQAWVSVILMKSLDQVPDAN